MKLRLILIGSKTLSYIVKSENISCYIKKIVDQNKIFRVKVQQYVKESNEIENYSKPLKT